MREFLSITDAVKMITREMEKDETLTFDDAFKIYNEDWYDGALNNEDKQRILSWLPEI